MKILADFGVRTILSSNIPDAVGTVQEMLDGAYENKISVLGIISDYSEYTEMVDIRKERNRRRQLLEVYERISKENNRGIKLVPIRNIYVHQDIPEEVFIGGQEHGLEIMRVCLNDSYWGVRKQSIDNLKNSMETTLRSFDIDIIGSPELHLNEVGADKRDRGERNDRYLNELDTKRPRQRPSKPVKDYLDWLVNKAKEGGIALELCEEAIGEEGSVEFDTTCYWLEEAKRNECKLILSSGARWKGGVGIMNKSIGLIKRIDYPDEQIINTDIGGIDQITSFRSR